MRNVQVRIKRIPQGVPTPDDFEVVETELPRVGNGHFLCKARWLSIDPLPRASPGSGRAQRALGPGDVVPAHGVYEVIESRNDVYGAGDRVVLSCGLQSHFVSDGNHARPLHPGQAPSSTALGILGPPGMAAYFGLLDLAQLRPGETVLVSAAANAAGAMAGQIAQLKGARAIGIAGSKEKCDWITRQARFAACINYRTEKVGARLRELAPAGIDVYFDSVGGEMLEKFIADQYVSPRGRVVLNALTARYDYGNGPGVHLETRVRLLTVDVRDYEARREEFLKDAIAWHGAGRLVHKEDVVEGLQNAPAQLCKLMRGENFGRTLVKP